MQPPVQLPVVRLRKKSLPEQIIHQLRSLMDSGRLPPGSRLPGERELSSLLGVSRPSLREAIRALSLLGIVENKPGRGTFLAVPSEKWPLEPFSIFLSINKGALLDIFEARQGLEASAAALAARRRTEESIRAIGESLERMEAGLAAADAEERRGRGTAMYDRFELQFHKAVVGAAGNPVIEDLMAKLYRLLGESRSRFYSIVARRKGYLREDCRSHRRIFEGIAAGDAKRAAAAMTDHLSNFERMLRREKASAGEKPVRPHGEARRVAGRSNGVQDRG